MQPQFQQKSYQIRKKIFSLIDSHFHIFDSHGNVLLYTKMKGFKLKEDLRVFTGEDMQTELLSIQARNILDFAATYDVSDSATGQKIGALKRKGWKSFVKDEWIILNTQDQEVGLIQEDNWLFAILRREVCKFIPQRFTATMNNTVVATYRQNFNPLVGKINVELSDSTTFDPRLAICAGILLCAIEGKQS